MRLSTPCSRMRSSAGLTSSSSAPRRRGRVLAGAAAIVGEPPASGAPSVPALSRKSRLGCPGCSLMVPDYSPLWGAAPRPADEGLPQAEELHLLGEAGGLGERLHFRAGLPGGGRGGKVGQPPRHHRRDGGVGLELLLVHLVERVRLGVIVGQVR